MAFNNTTMANVTAAPGMAGPPPGFDLGLAGLGSAIFLAFVSPTTIVLNSLLLFAIYKDPFKTFQSPSTYFLLGLTITDLVSGLVVEPFQMTCYFMDYAKHESTPKCFQILQEHFGILAAVAANSSFLIVLAFTIVQYLAVSWPLKYKHIVTIQRTVLCIISIWVYTLLFELSQKVGVPREVIEIIDLYLHTTTAFVVMVVVYILLQKSFHRKIKMGFVLRAESTIHSTSVNCSDGPKSPKASKPTQQMDIERRFIKINLLLIAVLFVCAIPTIITWFIYIYNPELGNSPDFFLVRVIVDNTLMAKFMFDPLIYAWRLPKYRKALRKSFNMQ